MTEEFKKTKVDEVICNTTPKCITVDQSLCSGCRICELTCSEKHYGVFNPKLSAIKIKRVYGGSGHWITTETCRQCPSSWCMRACPVEAISRNEDTGAIVVNEEKCIECGSCVKACPFGMIDLHIETGKAFKCDLCGGEPACVVECPNKALSIKSLTGLQMELGGAEND